MDEEDNFTKIEFPYMIPESGLKKVFKHIGQTLPGLVEYSAETTGSIGIDRFSGRFQNLEEKVIKGGFIRFKKGMHMLSFSVLSERNCAVRYKGIEFDIIPGYSKEEMKSTFGHNPNKMDNIRKIIDKYFKRYY